jgi:hypothetical protein
MREYRAYLIGDDSRIVERIDLVCIDETSARSKAEKLAVCHDVELWERARPIAVYHRQQGGPGKSE